MEAADGLGSGEAGGVSEPPHRKKEPVRVGQGAIRRAAKERRPHESPSTCTSGLVAEHVHGVWG